MAVGLKIRRGKKEFGEHNVLSRLTVLLKIGRAGLPLTAVLVETAAMPVPTKSRNPTVCG